LVLRSVSKKSKLDFLSVYGIDIPVIAQKGHALVFERPDCSLPEVPVMHWESRSAMTVFEGGLRLSGTVGEKSPRALLDVWEGIAPSVTKKLGAPIVEWTASRPVSSIGRPIIGSAPIENLWINTGHGHMGWSLCAGSAELMSRLIMGETAPEFSLP